MTEKDIENLIAAYPDEFFPNEGFKLIGQQVRLGSLLADILFSDKHARTIVVEVKKGVLSREAAGQITEYYGHLKNQNTGNIVELVLIANIVPSERRTFLENAGIGCREFTDSQIVNVANKYGYQIHDQNNSTAAQPMQQGINPTGTALDSELQRLYNVLIQLRQDVEKAINKSVLLEPDSQGDIKKPIHRRHHHYKLPAGKTRQVLGWAGTMPLGPRNTPAKACAWVSIVGDLLDLNDALVKQLEDVKSGVWGTGIEKKAIIYSNGDSQYLAALHSLIMACNASLK